jgi:hypothetical protein
MRSMRCCEINTSSPFIAGPSARVTGGPAEGVTGER